MLFRSLSRQRKRTHEASSLCPSEPFFHGPHAIVCTSRECPSSTSMPELSSSSIRRPSSRAVTLFPSARPGMLRRDQRRIVWSSEHEARRVPQGENLTTLTSSRCPLNRWTGETREMLKTAGGRARQRAPAGKDEGTHGGSTCPSRQTRTSGRRSNPRRGLNPNASTTAA